MGKLERPVAVVMNMFYTGLGIARSLGEQGIPVIGLSSQRRIYGNFTRYAKIEFCPDSRHEPEALLARLLQLGKHLGPGSVLFPTRDDDVAFLARFRGELELYFVLTIPETSVVEACLSKWETFLWAKRADVKTPECWLIEKKQDLARIIDAVTFPCVLKPVASRDWKQGDNWNLVGGRKAIGISSREELLAVYAEVARATEAVLLQTMVPGGDDCLLIAACYLDRNSKWVAGFNAQKLIQCPEGFGTGCIVQTANRPELFEPTRRILEKMSFTGIAEVEYKWDAAAGEYQLIEINPRPWDQHRLGKACGTDLMLLAYYEHAGLEMPRVQRQIRPQKWIAEDTFCMTALQLLWNRDPKLRTLFRLARGKKTYAVWSIRDPLPALAYLITSFIPATVRTGLRALGFAFKSKLSGKTMPPESLIYEEHLEDSKSRG
jgi:D-aspartate ligase